MTSATSATGSTTRRVLRAAGATTVAAALAMGAASCASGANDAQDGTIRVGTSPGPYSELFREGVVPILEDEGYEVTFDDFSELQQADVALQEGSVDLNVDQHTAYMENFNNESGADLAAITPIPTVPAGLYSSRHDNLDAVADGQSVSIPEDPSNASRAYRILGQAGWLTFADDADETNLTAADITGNPHDLDIRTLDSGLISRALDDVDWAVIPGSMSYAAGVDPDLQLLQEELLPDLELVAVVRGEDTDTDWADAVVEAYRSDEFADYLDGRGEGDYWYVPEALR
ncbi:MAG: MetQ/NlpA family ABC transporter substrate-binding protein [Corynebacterium sp.]|uniref:MetQ/NlpA family ABC transporter substrate-binding protein n=1 Tax=unclassified Corynebacterium TaxID=2624378 RepID=UPI00264924D1|nr:MetQ/NlpA family ABC transporter substrate-binding protein [Corynebacterium sp.]MDN5582863.1 MetQ/NlpA family ABC transporter substrate-binding protein [Corynebacterium sp.]MDN5720469.1 MetQ/NlpA family ABC transporter substrate-binding protein [Corynebacterium sp.]MDN6324930.1 MetQ/NlpA family ABC transporter substrate-binding protein [Corynebacterium sp.]